jgi:hypothetical protein
MDKKDLDKYCIKIKLVIVLKINKLLYKKYISKQ